MSRFLDALHSGRVLLMDGAMGTELQRAGMPEGACYEEWNLTKPLEVLAIHRSYVEAGAEVLLTNTFQAYRANLKKHDLAPKQQNIWTRGIELAKLAIGKRGYVIADLGQWVPSHQPDVVVMPWIAEADAFLLETLSHDNGVHDFAAFSAGFLRPPLPLLCSFTFLWHAGGKHKTREDFTPELCAAKAQEHGIIALGVNCGREMGLSDIVEVLHQYREACDLPLFARPNAGTPTKVNVRWEYRVTPEQMADAVPAMIEAGVTMIGGCCGTTPAHIAAMKKVVHEWNARKQ